MARSIGILAVQGGVAEHARAAESVGAQSILIRTVEELARVDGVIIPGGESSAITTLLSVSGLAEPLADRVKNGMPAFGSCAGLILLSEELDPPDSRSLHMGAIDITVQRNAFGRQVDSFETHLKVKQWGEEPAHAVFIRAPWIKRVGPGVETLAEVTPPHGGEPRVVAARQGNILVTAFHPELTRDRRWHSMFVSMIRE